MRLVIFYKFSDDCRIFCIQKSVAITDNPAIQAFRQVSDFLRSLQEWENCRLIYLGKLSAEDDSIQFQQAEFIQSEEDVGEREKKKMKARFYIANGDTMTWEEYCTVIDKILLRYAPYDVQQVVKVFVNDPEANAEKFDRLIERLLKADLPDESFDDDFYDIEYKSDLLFAGKEHMRLLRKEKEIERLAIIVFFILSEQTIIDKNTNLMWIRDGEAMIIRKPQSFETISPCGVTWYEANEFINRLNEIAYANYRDWKLPTKDELETLKRYRSIESVGFTNMTSLYNYWSYTSVDSDHAWIVNITGDSSAHPGRKTGRCAVLPVRFADNKK